MATENSTAWPSLEPSTGEPLLDTEETDNTWFVIQIVFGFMGTVTNLYAMVVIAFFTKMTAKIPGFLIFNQSCLDFGNSFMLFVNYLVFIDHGFVVPKSLGKIGGMLYCRFYPSECLQWGLLFASTYNLIAVNFERYLSVVHPVFHRSLTRTTFAYPAAVAVWLFGSALGISWAQVGTYMKDGDCMVYDFYGNEDLSAAYVFSLISLVYFVPLTLMGYFYGRMIRVLQKPGTKQGTDDAPAKMSSAQKNLFKTVVIVTMAYIFCWTLDQVSWFLYHTGALKTYDFNLYYAGYVMVGLNATANPLIYIANYREFKQGMKKMMALGKVEAAQGGTSS